MTDHLTSVWQGSRVRLRAVEASDWETFRAWNEDDDSSRALYTIPFPQSTVAVQRWTERESQREPTDDAFRWMIEDSDGTAVGGIATHTCDRRAGTFSYGVNVAAPFRRRGYAAEVIGLVLRFYFEELGYQKAHVHVYAFNAASIALHERLGFRLEGRLRRMVFTRGEHHDVLAFGLTAEEFAEPEARRAGSKRTVNAEAGEWH